MDEILTPEQWFELKFRLKLKYPELSDADLQYHEAIEEDMLEMVEYILQKTRMAVQGILNGQFRFSPLKNYWRYNRRNRITQKTA